MKTIKCFLCLAVALSLAACGGGGGGSDPVPVNDFEFGDPIEGLPGAQLAAFMRGKALMTKRFTPSEGLGPYYNASSCVSCHEDPVVGGSSPNYRNFYLAAIGAEGSQIPLFNPPDVPSIVAPNFNTTSGQRPTIPDSQPGLIVTVAQRNAPPMFGVGLFEFVTDATIMGLSDPNDMDGDGISGRFNRTAALRIGRFGYKCQANNIESFIRGAAQNQMGMTTDPVLGNGAIVSHSSGYMPQVTGGQTASTTDTDEVPDPEISSSDFADIIAFNKFLAPPPRKPDTAASLRGELLFEQIGCTGCHLPAIDSSLGPLGAYTDLLIHDMGPGLADGISMGIPQPMVPSDLTTGSEFRTQPLWGVSEHAPYLHDGRADTLDDAIRAHGGEAQAARDGYVNLTELERDDIIAFLEIL